MDCAPRSVVAAPSDIPPDVKRGPRPAPRVTGWWVAFAVLLAVATSPESPAVEAPVVTPPAAPAPVGAAPADAVIYPKNSPDRPKLAAKATDDVPVTGIVAIVLLLAAGGWMLFKRGAFLAKPAVPGQSRLAIEETRPLGNKQFLAVATYGDRKLLLAVCQGKIDLLCRLDESGGPADAARAAAAERPRSVAG